MKAICSTVLEETGQHAVAFSVPIDDVLEYAGHNMGISERRLFLRSQTVRQISRNREYIQVATMNKALFLSMNDTERTAFLELKSEIAQLIDIMAESLALRIRTDIHITMIS
jgi:hypothetical protein